MRGYLRSLGLAGLTAGLLILPSGACSAEPAGESAIRRAIQELDAVPDEQRSDQILWISNAIGQEEDSHTAGLLSGVLEEKLEQMAKAAGGREALQQSLEKSSDASLVEGSSVSAGEQESLLVLMAQANRPIPPEEELKKQIDALAYDPEHPEIGLNKAVEIGSVIDRISESSQRDGLRSYLQQRLEAIQQDAPRT